MPSLWVGIRPTIDETRILALDSQAQTLLRARLAPTPRHPRALAWLLESLALWEGQPVRAALAVGASSRSSATSPWLASVGETALFSLECVRALRPPRRDGVQLVLPEVRP